MPLRRACGKFVRSDSEIPHGSREQRHRLPAQRGQFVSRPPEDRGGELRALFFESASEILQSLNEAGLELEAHPSDEEVIRRIRRAVHTSKGDSAPCGFHKLSELAHELEDVLTPHVAQARGAELAELVLTAADSFGAMLTSYQRRKEPPAVDALHAMIRKLLQAPDSQNATGSAAPP